MQYDFERYASEITDGLTADGVAFAPQSWEDPIPFADVRTLDFPVDSLPGVVAEFVQALSVSTQTPVEMAGILSLGVLATAFQRRYNVQITPDWQEPLCLFTVSVAPPGERKSAVISALCSPIYEFEAKQRELDAAEIERNRTERALLEKSLEAAKNQAAKGRKGHEEARMEALELTTQLAEFKDIHPLRLLVDDTTPEKLADLMEQQGGCITVCSAEGGIFDSMQGRYDGKGGLDLYLKGHAGDPIAVDRMGRAGNYIAHPRITMLLTVQPEIIAGLMRNGTFKGRGLCGRFLYAMCRSKVGMRQIDPPPIPSSIKTGYQAFIRRILSADGSGTVFLSEEADGVRKDYQATVEGKLAGEWEHLRDWAGKLTGALVRIAALIHCAESEDPTEKPVCRDTMLAAVSIADYLASNALAAYQTMGSDGAMEDARYLWRRICSIGKSEISKRDLFKGCQGRYKKSDALDKPLNVLEDMGYIRITTVQTGGRPSEKIKVNPLGQK